MYTSNVIFFKFIHSWSIIIWYISVKTGYNSIISGYDISQ